MAAPELLRAPAGLSPSSRDWWRTVATEYDLSPADLRLLEVGGPRARPGGAVPQGRRCGRADHRRSLPALKAHPLLPRRRAEQRDLVRRAVATLGFRDEEPIGGRS